MTRADTLAIRTPEGIEFHLPLAGPFTRMLAYTVDFAVILAIGGAVGQAVAPLALFGPDAMVAVNTVLVFAISILYCAILEWLWRGQTVGKKLLGLRVIEASGLKLEPAQVVVRNLMRFIDFLPAFYLVGVTVCVLNSRRQRLGDIVAGTVVVRASKLKEPDLEQVLGGKYNSLAEQRHLAARLRHKVSPEVARTAFEAVLRRGELEPGARLTLFRELADYFRGVVAYPAEVVEQLSDEQYVRNVVEVLFARTKGAHTPR
ncbi:MAG TPA: RDD family protein [Bryobacteraceae bacterium]|jgi:uncharacterized RDD family membrane protein YckC